ncbi:MAG: polymer-forming cytoskeletal protein [Thermodesulfobacteriota bacterium]|nr:polymer-forming cytoskeletal protein [Thermodesulfobacteriota bacterium]
MLSRERGKDEEIKAFLGKGAEFNGKLVLNGLVRIDGEFKGEALGSGTLIIGEGAYVEADIMVDNTVIAGEVRGNLNIREKAEILATGRLLGNIKTAILVVKEGAVIDGACQMATKDKGEYTAAKTDE